MDKKSPIGTDEKSSLLDAIDIAQGREATNREMSLKSHAGKKVDTVKAHTQYRPKRPRSEKMFLTPTKAEQQMCRNCGRLHGFSDKTNYPATCWKSEKQSHWQSVCRVRHKPQHQRTKRGKNVHSQE